MTGSGTLSHLAATLAVNDDKVTPGLLGFVVFAVLAVATWLLMKSMNRQFKRVDFVEAAPTTEPNGAARTAEGELPAPKGSRDSA